jgi:hypothetical protein
MKIRPAFLRGAEFLLAATTTRSGRRNVFHARGKNSAQVAASVPMLSLTAAITVGLLAARRDVAKVALEQDLNRTGCCTCDRATALT